MIENVLNGKKYIGLTTVLPERRFNAHINSAKDVEVDEIRSESLSLAKAIKKYGKHNFKLRTLESGISSIIHLRDMEKFYIELLNTFGSSGYNKSKGGEIITPFKDEIATDKISYEASAGTFRLPNGKSLLLPRYKNYDDRISVVSENILGEEPFCHYYNPCNKEIKTLNEDEADKLDSKWLGVKVVGKPNTDDSFKHSIDYLSGYILRADEYNVKELKDEYFSLVIKNDLNREEKNRLREISSLIIYEDINKHSKDRSAIFIENRVAEVAMQDRLVELERMNDRNYSEDFIYKDIQTRLKRCFRIKDKVLDLASLVRDNKEDIKELKINIQENSKESKLTMGDANAVIKDAGLIKEAIDNLKWLRFEAKELVEEYESNIGVFQTMV